MTTRQQAHRRREAAIATAKTAVTVASVAAALGGCALIGLTDSSSAAVQDTTAPQEISANVTVVGSPTPIPSATPRTSTGNSGQAGVATNVPTQTPRPTVTPAPTQIIIQPGLRQPPGFGNNNFFAPRTRTSR